jgi:hypothetical protein
LNASGAIEIAGPPQDLLDVGLKMVGTVSHSGPVREVSMKYK